VSPTDNSRIVIVIPEGPRPAKIREVHERSRQRRLDEVNRRLATATDPIKVQQLEALKAAIENETVQAFIMKSFVAMVRGDEVGARRKQLEDELLLAMQQALAQHIQDLNDLGDP
jgi:hypothetical protein